MQTLKGKSLSLEDLRNIRLDLYSMPFFVTSKEVSKRREFEVAFEEFFKK